MNLMSTFVPTIWLEVDLPGVRRLLIGGVYHQWSSAVAAKLSSNWISGLGMEREELDIPASVLSIFQIVEFPGGVTSGTCAQGFGVCCIFSLSCGQTTSENCTYITQTSTASPMTNPCEYTICKCSSNICRIRLDFASFSIGGPTTGLSPNTPVETSKE
eukprot:maker-scaffold713_size108309-snap-gene-0.13 protein:Tk04840 transcript:maker-scaffold713_size108309-snap-gene-0.13-mRNA-1 annotation:"conserved hypothetical protein"